MAKKNQGKHVKPSTPESSAANTAQGTPPSADVAKAAQPVAPQTVSAPASQPVAAPQTPVLPVIKPATALPPGQGVNAAGMPTGAWQMSAIPPESSRHRGLKIFGIVIGVLIALLAAVYFAGVFVFSGRFFPHTTILDMDVSGKTPEEVHLMLDDMLGDYTFKVEGHGIDLTLAARDMGMTLDSQSIADNLLAQMNPWAWPLEVFEKHDNTEDLVSTFEETKLADTIQAAVDAVNADAQAPVDASIAFDESVGAYKIVPEQEGTTIMAEEVLAQVTDGTVNFAPTVKLTDAVLARPGLTQDDPSLAAAREQANKYLDAVVQLTFAGEPAGGVDAEAIVKQIKFGKGFEVKFDVGPLVKDIQEKVDKMDTTGAERTYTRPDGKTFTVKGGDYGWITDSEATAKKVREALESGQGGTIEIVMKLNAGQYPDENGRDFGNRFIDVDLTKQVAIFYDEDGKVIWKSKIVSGLPKDGRDTPTGTYWLKTNDGASVLKGFKPDGSKDYETPVDYWMPFKDNSVGFHDANWQAKFGGDWYKSHGSHGCVNLPVDKAKKLHKLIKVGDAVVVHN